VEAVSASQRAKGQRGEREAYQALWEQLGDVVEKRDLSQTRDGGGDIRIPAARVLLEVKRTERRSVSKWRQQAAESAEACGEGWVGVVFWRRNLQRWEAWRTDVPYRRGQDGLKLAELCDWVRGRLGHG